MLVLAFLRQHDIFSVTYSLSFLQSPNSCVTVLHLFCFLSPWREVKDFNVSLGFLFKKKKQKKRKSFISAKFSNNNTFYSRKVLLFCLWKAFQAKIK